ncbi:MAG TPA: type II toxin-antitoxin system VapC family toxin [Candidatus Dormibacteraeota bacterium]|jgi:predicted nucleic acid-binding protein|nr:type II toxin-antitoxin system VapC family toxin [Candidatus Dormibacteraeota bacterium]
MVVDASVLIQALAIEEPGGPVGVRLARETVLHAPSHVGVEFANGVRRLELHGKISPDRAAEALDDFLSLPIQQHRFEPLAHRAWALRHHLTAYDAAYVALAENLGRPLHTLDARLASIPGLRGAVVVL